MLFLLFQSPGFLVNLFFNCLCRTEFYRLVTFFFKLVGYLGDSGM